MAHAWKACWVQALGGSNPPSSATGPRDLLRFRGFCCLQPRLISGRRESCPPARSPHASFARSGRSRSPPVPSGPSGALHTGGTCVAWTSPARPSKPVAPSTPAALVLLGLARRGPAAAHRHRRRSLQTSGALRTGGACGAVCTGRQSGAHGAAEPRPRPLRLRDLRRSLRPGAQPGPRPSQRASIGACPSRCSSIRPRTPSR